jgi:hypothetical protein
MCGRKLHLSKANKKGARCPYDGAQYDFVTGELLYHAATPPQRYRVTEVRAYEVKALCEADACNKIMRAGGNRHKFCVEIEDRYAKPVEQVLNNEQIKAVFAQILNTPKKRKKA